MKNIIKSVVIAAAVVGATSALATGTDTAFGNLLNTMTSWTSGYLVKSLSLVAFLFGAGVGIAKQSLIPAMFGLFLALTLMVGPNIITGMFGATV
jgi:conjugal transfer pilus assembly protein TraA